MSMNRHSHALLLLNNRLWSDDECDSLRANVLYRCATLERRMVPSSTVIQQ